MIRRLTPASNKCVAYECLSVCTCARFARPLRRTARRNALCVVGDVNCSEFAGAMQPREHLAVTAIGFHAIPTALRNHRRADHDAVFTAAGEMPIDPEPARAGFVDEMQRPARRAQRPYDLVERLEVARDHAVVADFALAFAIRDRHLNRFLVDIQPYEHATVPHDLPPCVWPCAKP